MKTSTNYSLPLYEETDNPDLITGYNAAVTSIDTQMKENADDAASAMSDAATAQQTATAANNTAKAAQTTANEAKAAIPSLSYVKLTVGELAKGLNVAYKAS